MYLESLCLPRRGEQRGWRLVHALKRETKVSETIRLKASDGFELSAYVAKPSGTPKGGFVVIQEIFGVNGHIRRITDGFARDGFLAIAPALFDRIEPGIELGYSP